MKNENNLERPKEAGYYMTEDTEGTESFQYFNGNHWSSTTGHPIKYWSYKDEPTDTELEKWLEQ